MKRWILLITLVAVYFGVFALDPGVYYVKSAINPTYILDNDHSRLTDGNNIQLWKFNGTNAQKWLVFNTEKDVYVLCNQTAIPEEDDVRTFHVLDVNNSVVANGTNLQLWTFNNTGAQKWYLHHHGGNTYSICSIMDINYVVDLSNSKVADGTNIQLYRYNATKAQQWIFVKATL
ncbi:MAG: RICIN domain-containing protein [Clostridium sp.]|nr:RICIN domain-containing protein [Prevotella sp.]MCM1428337.1 RICIN domain-containing protein [Clostridium sp.]